MTNVLTRPDKTDYGTMTSVCFYFQVHQPWRLKSYNCFQIGHDHEYFDDEANRNVLDRVADKCYLPANRLMLELLNRHEGQFRIAYSITGTALDQMEQFRPDVVASFQELAATGCVEFLAETYYHSLSFLYSRDEFMRQVRAHTRKIEALFQQTPSVFRNTELIYNNELAAFVERMGYKGILCEGLEYALQGRSPNFVYHPPYSKTFACLPKNYKLSDDIAFRFSDKGWQQWPLTAPRFAHWVHQTAGNGETINLFMDYETFGEHQWPDTGIFDFLRCLPAEILRHPDFDFLTPSEVIDRYPARGAYDVHAFSSWADLERDLSAWLGNGLQQDAAERIYALEQLVKSNGTPELLDTWARLLTSDHLYYMCTKYWQDGDVHKYFSHYDTPYEGYINYMNVVTDLEYLLERTPVTAAYPSMSLS